MSIIFMLGMEKAWDKMQRWIIKGLKLEEHWSSVSEALTMRSDSLVHGWWPTPQYLQKIEHRFKNFERGKRLGDEKYYLNVRCWCRTVSFYHFLGHEPNTTFPSFRWLNVVFDINLGKKEEKKKIINQSKCGCQN